MDRIPVSVGIAPTKTLAKVANRRAKKDPASGGVCLLLDAAAQTDALSRMELTDLWGVARRLAERLKALGVMTPLDLRDADRRFIRERFNVVLERMVLELRGVPCCIGLEEVTPDRKSIIASRSFGRPVETAAELREAVTVHTARAAEKMRRQHLTTANLTVFVQTNSFKPADPQYANARAIRLPVATADSGKLVAAAMTCLNAIYRPGFRYKKAGVTFLDLKPAGQVQGGLFDPPDDTRSTARMRALDALNARYGRGTVTIGTAGQGRGKGWTMRRDHTSARFTTDWHELLKV